MNWKSVSENVNMSWNERERKRENICRIQISSTAPELFNYDFILNVTVMPQMSWRTQIINWTLDKYMKIPSHWWNFSILLYFQLFHFDLPSWKFYFLLKMNEWKNRIHKFHQIRWTLHLFIQSKLECWNKSPWKSPLCSIILIYL